MLSDKNYSEHPGLRGALKSLRHKRSGKNAYILLLGMTGSGKSSAVSIKVLKQTKTSLIVIVKTFGK